MQPFEQTLNRDILIKARPSQVVARELAPHPDLLPTGGDAMLEISPPTLKFEISSLDTLLTATVRLINKSSVPQRVHILPPISDESPFAIKCQKKGAIPTGMSEPITVSFRPTKWTYLQDAIRVKTETGSFAIPLFAYPVIPNIANVFPRVIDFGQVLMGANSTMSFSLINPTPVPFPFQFGYLQQSPAFMITPIEGQIQPKKTTNIEITFLPKKEVTSTAQCMFNLEQFDAKPVKIKLLGNGVAANNVSTLKGSKANLDSLPNSKLNQTSNNRIRNSATLRRPPSVNTKNAKAITHTLGFQTANQTQKDNSASNIDNNGVEIKQASAFASPRSASIQLDYPSQEQISRVSGFEASIQPQTLLKSKPLPRQRPANTMKEQTMIATTNLQQANFRPYLMRFGSLESILKEKQIRFERYYGDRPLLESQIEQHQTAEREVEKEHQRVLREEVQKRYQIEKNRGVEVDERGFPAYAALGRKRHSVSAMGNKKVSRVTLSGSKSLIAVQQTMKESQSQIKALDIASSQTTASNNPFKPSFSSIRNDDLHPRRLLLLKFNLVASKIIARFRASKRLKMINNWLNGATKETMPKKLEEQQKKAGERGAMGSASKVEIVVS